MSTKASKKAKLKKEGLCSLTGGHGEYVKSHILPRALTRLSRTGERVREAELGGIPRWRTDTWYDDELVTRAGEDILEAIDTPAIDILRKHSLVWSAFDCDEPFSAEDFAINSEGFGYREISVDAIEADKLRLFFLSIAWRAAASLRPEFKDFQLEAEEIEDLRKRVLARTPGTFFEYPIVLDQIITRGDAHNRVPILESYDLSGDGEVSLESIRIYMDGLVARVFLTKDKNVAQQCGPLFLGAYDRTTLTVRSFASSRAHKDMCEVIRDNIKRGYV